LNAISAELSIGTGSWFFTSGVVFSGILSNAEAGNKGIYLAALPLPHSDAIESRSSALAST
jgi:hypothetical protein